MTFTPHTFINETVFDISGTSLLNAEPKVTNYQEIIFDDKLSNKSNSNIFEAIMTLIKATSYVQEKAIQGENEFKKEIMENSQMKSDFIKNPYGAFNVFYPVIVFEGKMYLVDFEAKSKIKEIPMLLLSVEHNSIHYSGTFYITIVNKEHFKKFIKFVENDLSLFKKRAEKNIKEINLSILESYGFVTRVPEVLKK